MIEKAAIYHISRDDWESGHCVAPATPAGIEDDLRNSPPAPSAYGTPPWVGVTTCLSGHFQISGPDAAALELE
jgi:hypothetical protein